MSRGVVILDRVVIYVGIKVKQDKRMVRIIRMKLSYPDYPEIIISCSPYFDSASRKDNPVKISKMYLSAGRTPSPSPLYSFIERQDIQGGREHPPNGSAESTAPHPPSHAAQAAG